MVKTSKEGERSLLKQTGSVHPQTMVIGLGNPILGDDGAGGRVAERLQTRLRGKHPASIEAAERQAVEIDCLSLGGLSLMERLIGYRRAVIIDIITTKENQPGAVTCFSLDDLPKSAAGHTGSTHDTSLSAAIEVGRLVGAELPDEIMVVAIEANVLYDFSDQLTAPVEAALPLAEQAVLRILSAWNI